MNLSDELEKLPSRRTIRSRRFIIRKVSNTSTTYTEATNHITQALKRAGEFLSEDMWRKGFKKCVEVRIEDRHKMIVLTVRKDTKDMRISKLD